MAVLRYFHQDPRQTSVQESSVIDKQGTVLTQKLTTINQSITNNTQVLEDKLNSVPGKSLSTNDFTDEYKNKLRGIEEGAEVNVQSDWGEDDNTADSYIKNKPVIDDIVTQNSENLITSGAVFTAIDELPEPMIFKGSLGTGGTIQTLPAPSADNVGFVYKVITAGTYYGITAKPGDSFISDSSDWILIPSGDEPEGTVMSVGLLVPTGLLVSGSPITTSGTLAITYALGYAIPTTAKLDEWDAKQNAISDLSTIRTNASNGNTAYGWGNHANAGYLAAISDLATIRSNASEGHTAYGWGNHANAGYVKSSGVTSVAMTVPTGLSISGSPITSTGTLALSFANGYSIPTTAKLSNWDTAYGWGNHANAGYLTGITKAMVTNALGYTPPQQDTNTTYSAGSGLSLSGTTFSLALTKALVTTALGYTPPTQDTNTWRGITDSYSGTDSSISLSQKGGNALYNTLVNGYASSAGNADTVDGCHASSFLFMNTAGGIASVSGGGLNWWFKIATIKIVNAYINRPIVFEISLRGYEFSILLIIFYNDSGTDPGLYSFTTNNVAVYYIKKTATSTWEVYGKYSEAWGLATLHRITGCGANIGVTVNMVNIGTSDPTGITQCTYSGNVNYANSAGSVAWTNVSNRPTNLNLFTNGPGYITGITKTMVTNALGYTPPTSDTNNAVTLTNTTTNAFYRVLFSQTADNTTRTEGARKSSDVYVNPNTKTLHALGFFILDNITDMWTDSFGNTHPWYGIDGRLLTKGTDLQKLSAYRHSLSCYFGMHLHTRYLGITIGDYNATINSGYGNDAVVIKHNDYNDNALLRVDGEIRASRILSQGGKLYIQNRYDGSVIIGESGTSGPWVGIGIENPSYKLHVNGACGATSFPNTSDIRLKDILSEWLPKLEDIANAPSFLFKWNNIKDDTVHLGSSAQYWEEKAPNVVTEANDEIKTKSLQYDVLGTVNSIAIAKEVVSLKEEIKLLQALIAELKLLLNN